MRPGRRFVRGLAALVAVVGLAVATAACGGSAAKDDAVRVEVGDPGETAPAVLAHASETTGAVETGRLRMTYRINMSGQDESSDGTLAVEGSFAEQGRLVELTVDMSGLTAGTSGPNPEGGVMSEMVDGTTVYMKINAAQSLPGFGAGWMKFDATGSAGGSIGFGGGLASGPSGIIESLKGAGADVVESGTDTIDGVDVTVYEGTIDPLAAAAAASPDKADEVQQAIDELGMTGSMPFTAWVDGEGMVRRLELDLHMSAGGTAARMQMVLELYDFGAPVTITVPSADEVTDLGAMLGFGTDGEGMFGTA